MTQHIRCATGRNRAPKMDAMANVLLANGPMSRRQLFEAVYGKLPEHTSSRLREARRRSGQCLLARLNEQLKHVRPDLELMMWEEGRRNMVWLFSREEMQA